MQDAPFTLSWSGGELSLDRCRVMGILNVTPDSFSDGGRFFSKKEAVTRAWQIVEEGADILDIGAESTRPGSAGVQIEEEKNRLWPVLTDLRQSNYPLPISLDTTKPELAKQTLSEGLSQIINDVEGLRNPLMVDVVKEYAVPVVLMHMFGTPRSMQNDFHYHDVVEDLIIFFQKRISEIGLAANLVIDPGIGFGKSVDHNLELLARLRAFSRLGHPILVGASRKSFIGKVLDVDIDQRLEGSLAAAAIAVFQGAKIIRAHDVLATRRVVGLAEAIREKDAA